jgi:hypothetical protein
MLVAPYTERWAFKIYAYLLLLVQIILAVRLSQISYGRWGRSTLYLHIGAQCYRNVGLG